VTKKPVSSIKIMILTAVVKRRVYLIYNIKLSRTRGPAAIYGLPFANFCTIVHATREQHPFLRIV
jgi:hypothetical protein